MQFKNIYPFISPRPPPPFSFSTAIHLSYTWRQFLPSFGFDVLAATLEWGGAMEGIWHKVKIKANLEYVTSLSKGLTYREKYPHTFKFTPI